MKIVTGGQTGVDMAALQFASDTGIAYGGWVPKGRTNEAGRIPRKFKGLTQTRSSNVSERTKLNVLACDALLVFIDGSTSPGTQLTIDFAQQVNKPVLVVDTRNSPDRCAIDIRTWLSTHRPDVLNIAGPRQSQSPNIGARVTDILHLSLGAFIQTRS